MDTREAVALIGIGALWADKKVRAPEKNTLYALMQLNPLFSDVPDQEKYIGDLSLKYKDCSFEQIADMTVPLLDSRMKETSYAWVCALISSDLIQSPKEYVFLSLLARKFDLNGILAGKISAVVSMLSRKQ